MRAWLAYYMVGHARRGGYRADGVAYKDWRDDALEALRVDHPDASRRDAETLIRQMARRWPQAFGYNAWYAVHTYRS